MANYSSSFATGSLVDSALTKANSALQPAAIGVTVQAYDANTAKLDVAQTWTAKQTLSGGIIEPSATLAQSGGTLTLPTFVGQTHRITPSANITTISLPTLTAGEWCELQITNTGGYSVVQIAGWHANGMATPVSTVAGSITIITLNVLGNGALRVSTEVLGLVS